MTKHGTILLIEDDANEVVQIRKAFDEVEAACPLHIVFNPGDAIQYLSGEGAYANRDAFPLPFLIILNLKLPDEGGFTLLRWLYERPGLRKKFNLIVLASPSPEQEIQLAYELGAQSFLFRTPDYRQLVQTLRGVKEYWIGLNVLPRDVA